MPPQTASGVPGFRLSQMIPLFTALRAAAAWEWHVQLAVYGSDVAADGVDAQSEAVRGRLATLGEQAKRLQLGGRQSYAPLCGAVRFSKTGEQLCGPPLAPWESRCERHRRWPRSASPGASSSAGSRKLRCRWIRSRVPARQPAGVSTALEHHVQSKSISRMRGPWTGSSFAFLNSSSNFLASTSLCTLCSATDF